MKHNYNNCYADMPASQPFYQLNKAISFYYMTICLSVQHAAIILGRMSRKDFK